MIRAFLTGNSRTLCSPQERSRVICQLFNPQSVVDLDVASEAGSKHSSNQALREPAASTETT
jgi:hypothetical protein